MDGEARCGRCKKSLGWMHLDGEIHPEKPT